MDAIKRKHPELSVLMVQIHLAIKGECWLLRLSKDKVFNNEFVTRNICLNDQGGSMISITYGITSTLRSEMHQHPPLVLDYKKEINNNG